MAVFTNGGSSPSPWAGFSWYDKVRNAMAGIPEYIWGSIVGVESSGNPRALGDGGKSYGLFQEYTAGGLGDAYKNDPTKLFDPELNAQIAAKAMKPAYDEGIKRGLSGFSLTEYVASHAGWPLTTGNMPASYRAMLHTQYNSNYAGGGGSGGGSGGGGGAPASNPVPASDFAPNGTTIFHSLDSIERLKFSILSPAESTQKVAAMILMVLLGLIMIGIGLVTFIGIGQSASLVANVATGGESGAIQEAVGAAGSMAEKKEAKAE